MITKNTASNSSLATCSSILPAKDHKTNWQAMRKYELCMNAGKKNPQKSGRSKVWRKVMCLIKKRREKTKKHNRNQASGSAAKCRLGGGAFICVSRDAWKHQSFSTTKGWWCMSRMEKYVSPKKYVNYQRQGWNVVVDSSLEDRCFQLLSETHARTRAQNKTKQNKSYCCTVNHLRGR